MTHPLSSLLSVFSRSARVISSVAVVVVTLFTFLVGVGGIDYGSHWDEWYHCSGAHAMVEGMSLFLSSHQSYGGLYFYLGLPVLLVKRFAEVQGIFHELLTRSPYGITDLTAWSSIKTFKETAHATIDSGPYVLGVRTMFLALSTTSVIWTYLASLRLWPKRYYIALSAACFVAFSWQLQYHARMIAIDAPTSAFAALHLFLFCAAYRARTVPAFVAWYAAMAASSGLAFGCKAPAAFFVFPVLILPWLWSGNLRGAAKLGLTLFGGFVFTVFTALVSPSLFLDPLHFLAMLRSGTADYNDDRAITHPHYVSGLGQHVQLFYFWMLVFVPSPWRVLAVLCSLVSGIGFLFLVKTERRLMIIWTAFFVAFAFVFMRNHLMIPRQYLIWVPFMALMFATGLTRLHGQLQGRVTRWFVPVGALVLVIANGSFAVASMMSIRNPRPERFLQAAEQDLLRRPEVILVSGRLYRKLETSIKTKYTCQLATIADREIPMSVSFFDEHPTFTSHYPAFEKVYANPDMDYVWYNDWQGQNRSERLVRMRTAEQVWVGFDFKDTYACRPLR